MKVKNAIKKVGAVAGSALMVGMTMGAAQSLSEFPQPFVADDGTVQSQVVVGANAKTADVVGAINVAAALGQNTVQTETREVTAGGTTETTVNGTELEEGIGDASDPTPIQTAEDDTPLDGTVALGADDVPQLFRDNIEYEDNSYFEAESVTVDGSQVEIQPNGTSTEVLMDVGTNAIQHTASFTPALPNGSTFQLAGQEYQFIELDTSTSPMTVVLGETTDATGLSSGDSVSFGPYTVTVGSPNLEGNAVQVTVREDGTQIDSFALSDGETETSDDGNLEITGESVFVSIDQEVDVSLALTWRNTEVQSGEDAPMDDQYTVDTVSAIDGATNSAPHDVGDNYGDDVDVLESITLSNQYATGDDDGDYTDPLDAGMTFQGPDGQYGLTFTGLSDERTEDVTIARNAKVTYTDANSMEHSVDLREAALANDNPGSNLASADYIDPSVLDDGDVVPVGSLPIEVESTSFSSSSAEATIDFAYQQWDPSATTITLDDATPGSATVKYAVSSSIDPDYRQPFKVIVGYTDGTGSDDLTLHGWGIVDAGETSDVTANDPFSDGDGDDVNLADNFETGDGALIETPSMSSGNSVTDGVGDGDDVVVGENPTVTASGTVTVDFDGDGRVDTDGTDDVVYTDSNADNNPLEEEDSFITDAGSTIDFASDTRVDFELTTAQRVSEAALGTYGESTVGGETVEYDAAVGQGTVPDMAMLDSEVTDQTKSNNHLILVGGPAVNQLVADLATAGDTWTQSEWQNQHDGEALLQVVQDAFVQDRHALIVAGHSAEDTRVAAEYISNYADNADELSAAGNQKVLTSANYMSQ